MKQKINNIIFFTFTLNLLIIIFPFSLTGQELKKEKKLVFELMNGKSIGPYQGIFYRNDSNIDSQNFIYYYQSIPSGKEATSNIYKVPFSEILLMVAHIPAVDKSKYFHKFKLFLEDTTIDQAYFWYKDGFKIVNEKKKSEQLIYIKSISNITFENK